MCAVVEPLILKTAIPGMGRSRKPFCTIAPTACVVKDFGGSQWRNERWHRFFITVEEV